MNALKNSYIVNFLKKYTTMCKAHVAKQCFGCPLYDKAKDEQKCDIYNENTDLEILVSIVNLWESHSEKTMMQDFFEKFPKAHRTKDGAPRNICPSYCGYTNEPESYAVCEKFNDDCVACWSRSLEE